MKISPDALLRAYTKATEGGSDPGFVEIPGRECEECGSRVMHTKITGEWVCGHCGAAWPKVEVSLVAATRRIVRAARDNRTWPYIYVNPTRAERAGLAEDAMVSIVEIGIVLAELEADDWWRIPSRLWRAHVLTSATWEEIATYANEVRWPVRRPKWGDSWTATRVEYTSRTARREFARRYESRTGRAE